MLNDLNTQPPAMPGNGPPGLPGPNRPRLFQARQKFQTKTNKTGDNTANSDSTTSSDTNLAKFADTFTGQSKARGLGFLRGPSAIGAFLRSVRGASQNPGVGLAIGHTNGNNGNNGRRVRRRCRGKCK
jgi:hypothetical protein